MSQAKIWVVKRAQKDQGKCGHCGITLPPGVPYRHFTVGFRSRSKNVRCMKVECSPTRAERESSKLAEIYAAIDDASFDGCETTEGIKSVLEQVAEVARGLSEEYAEASVNQNTGAVFNVEAEERGQTLEAYADELESWDPDEEEPEKPEDEDDEKAMTEYEELHGVWVDAAQNSAREALEETDF